MTSPTVGFTKRQFYWSCQLGGWLLYVFTTGLYSYLGGRFSETDAFQLILIFLFGILLTELLRWVIIKFNWLNMPVMKLLPLVLGMNIVMGVVLTFVNLGGLEKFSFEKIDWGLLFFISLGYTFVFFVWSILYFLVHFLENYKKAEIENLRWQAAIRETELNKLKSQLNPHFMFNAMNSIRALVAEDPARAKEAITQLANLLRNTLQLGRHKLIPLGQELDVVRDYLAIESVRLEERLKVKWKISGEAESVEVPPMMVQTLVENGIKHGIAHLPEGGTLEIEAVADNEGLHIVIRNSGNYDASKIPESGFGMRNTKERLQLLYGNRSTFSINNENGSVVTQLFIPNLTKTANT